MPSKRSRTCARRKKVEAVKAKMSAVILDALKHSIGKPLSEQLLESLRLQAEGVLGTKVRVVDLPPDKEAEQRLDGTFDPNKITFEATIQRPRAAPFIELSFLVAGELAGNAVCVKKLEAVPMDSGIKGMTGMELEQALKSDAKDRAMDWRIDPGTKPPLNLEPAAVPGSSAPQPPKKEWITPSITSIVATTKEPALSAPKFIPPSPEVAQVLRDGLLRDSDKAAEIARGKWGVSGGKWVQPDESVKFVPPEEVKPTPSKDLPAGMKMVLWIPIQQGDGTTIFQCSVEGFGYKVTASSRNKVKALAYALEDMARMMVEAER